VELNEAQLINPQNTNKNMAARNKVLEWLKYGGRIEYEDNNVTIIRDKNNEWLVIYNEWVIHVIPGKMVATMSPLHRYVAYAPTWRGYAVRLARSVLANAPIPSSVKQMIPLPLPP
jgi:hypothetical protein